jgi:truncated hemoglobin YjbI
MARVFENLGGATGGGEARVRALLLKFYERMAGDVMLLHFFTGRDVAAIAEKQGEFLLRAMGASPTYSGKAPGDAHRGLPPIWTGHFNRRLVILREVLLGAGLSEADADAWVSFEDAFRETIVGK